MIEILTITVNGGSVRFAHQRDEHRDRVFDAGFRGGELVPANCMERRVAAAAILAYRETAHARERAA